jgi:hypothetical protein
LLLAALFASHFDRKLLHSKSVGASPYGSELNGKEKTKEVK